MNEYNPEIPFEEPSPYKDYSTGLIIFGILTIMLGCLSGLFVPLMLFGQAAASNANGAAVPFSAIVPGMVVYGTLAIALVWLGIGTILARRWARALMLIFSWSWLVMGIFAVGFMLIVVPEALEKARAQTGHHAMPPVGIVSLIILLIFGGIFIVLPAVWIFFFRSANVKATCEARDPMPGWTDVCPLPVLAVCLWTMFSVPIMLVLPMSQYGVVPFFGMFLTGSGATFFYLMTAAIWAFAAWLMYKLDQRGWWLILIAMCIYLVSNVLTFAQHDITEMYRLMNYSVAQIDAIQKTGLLAGNRSAWIMALCAAPFLGYLLYIKKFFRGDEQIIN